MYKIYIKDEERYKKLEELHKRKYELKTLLDNRKERNPFIVELSGMPRTGKTVSTERIFEFFKMANYKVLKTKEPAQIVKERYDITKLSGVEFNDKTLEISREQLDYCKSQKPDIILQDRGVFDNFIWYQMMFQKGEISEKVFLSKIRNINDVLKENDQLYLMTADPEIIVQRDYNDQIFLEPRKKTTVECVTALKNGMNSIMKKVSGEDIIRLDTSYMSEIDIATKISNNIIDGMIKKLTYKKM